MAKIKLIRVDSRLIHGQVITKWITQAGANLIVIIDDILNNDSFMKDIYIMAAPKGIDVKVFGVAEAADKFNSNELENKNALILFKDMKSLVRSYDSGFPIEKVQIGGLPGGPGRKNVYKAISLDEEDVKNIEYLRNKSVEIYMQMIPEDDPIDYERVKSKF